MIEIELPCCGTVTHVVLVDAIECATCGVVLELADPSPEALPAAA